MRDEVQPTNEQASQTGNSKADAESGGEDARSNARSAHVSDDPVYVISVAAKLVGMPAWTLRVLDEQAIVSPKRTDKNRRLYSDSDLSKLVRVRSLTEELGVNMNGVRIILQLEEQNKINETDQQQQS